MGHYVVGHVWRHVLVLPLLVFFVLAARHLPTGGDSDTLVRALLKTAEYRYPRPHPWQEFVFHGFSRRWNGRRRTVTPLQDGRRALRADILELFRRPFDPDTCHRAFPIPSIPAMLFPL